MGCWSRVMHSLIGSCGRLRDRLVANHYVSPGLERQRASAAEQPCSTDRITPWSARHKRADRPQQSPGIQADPSWKCPAAPEPEPRQGLRLGREPDYAYVRFLFLFSRASTPDSAAADLAFFSARFSLMDFPCFLDIVLRGDLSDNWGVLCLQDLGGLDASTVRYPGAIPPGYGRDAPSGELIETCSVAPADDERDWHACTFGFADAVTARLMSPDRRFRIGSITEVFVATVIPQPPTTRS